MKKIFSHPPRDEKPVLWRSLEERENTADFNGSLGREFSDAAAGREADGLSRRDFVRLMGAATALTGVGLTGCRRPEAHLVPFAKAAEWTIPGKFLYYASAMPSPTGAVPVIVTTTDGRPVKIEGNPLHPLNSGASNGSTDAFAQASVLDLYDPHRSKEITHDSLKVGRGDLDNLLARIRATADSNGGEGLAILVGRDHSPTVERLRSSLARQFPKMLWFRDEAIGTNEAAFDALLGAGVRPSYDFAKADVILSVGSDFLNPSDAGFGFAQGFAGRRDPKGSMNRLYVAENHYSLTGGMADHRLRVRASELGDFASAVAKAVAVKTGSSDLASLAAARPSTASFDSAWISGVADDLVSAKGRGIVIAGNGLPADVQALVLAINSALGNLGATVTARQTAVKTTGTLADLCGAIQSGSVQSLLILGGNPVLTAPALLDFPNLLARVPETLHLSLFSDETGRVTHWQVPAAHYLESWGDCRSVDGTICAVQPMILPLWNGVSAIEILSALAGEKIDGP